MAIEIVYERDPIAPAEDELAALRDIALALAEAGEGPLALSGPDGEALPVPSSLRRVLRRVSSIMANGHAAGVVDVARELSTEQAANLVGVSRPYFVSLLEQGEIPFTLVGTHRRVRFDDLMAWKRVRDEQRREALRELTRLSQEMGFYQPAPPNTSPSCAPSEQTT